MHVTKSWALSLAALSLTATHALSTSTPKKVVVTGAGGQTGQALFRKLLTYLDEFTPIGFVRTPESKQSLVNSGLSAGSIAVVDVTDGPAVKAFLTSSPVDAFCICTSGKPAPTGVMTEEGKPVFGYPNGSPEEVDWIGQRNQINACGAGTHVVVCSSMGGTDPSNMLNKLGRTVDSEGKEVGGNILKWKRKAEKYLIDSGLPYTIVHPGGLLNEPGGERELVVGVDDSQEGTTSRLVPREDVAEVMLQALRNEGYRNRSFDLRAKDKGDGVVTTDFAGLLGTLEGKNTDYSLGEIM
mmetsp:Transcript_517/g.602  ORF Transcript_517/g.602 Transcript_517/m.602 type:complete len:297 (+) Transcript_517:142-1032(+)